MARDPRWEKYSAAISDEEWPHNVYAVIALADKEIAEARLGERSDTEVRVLKKGPRSFTPEQLQTIKDLREDLEEHAKELPDGL